MRAPWRRRRVWGRLKGGWLAFLGARPAALLLAHEDEGGADQGEVVVEAQL